MEERSLEMTEVSREGGRGWCRQESGLQILWKKERESLSRLSLSEFKLATNSCWCGGTPALFSTGSKG